MLVSRSSSTDPLCEKHHKICIQFEELSENTDERQAVWNEAMTSLNGISFRISVMNDDLKKKCTLSSPTFGLQKKS